MRPAWGVGALILTLALAGPTHAARRLSGAAVTAALATHGLSLERATIHGDIRFGGLAVVRHPFSCHDCRIDGRVVGDDTVFDSTLDLSGSQIAGPVLMRRARFEKPVVFGPTLGDPGYAIFRSRADFTLASFRDIASFDAATFLQQADFTATQFGAEAGFSDAAFGGPATFDRALFRSSADFRLSGFGGRASFEAARFKDDATFSDSTFADETVYSEARFGRDVTFLGTLFTYDGRGTYGVTFERMSARGNVVFDLATFNGRAEFRRATVGGTISFDEVEFAPPPTQLFVFAGVGPNALQMDVDAALRFVEASDRQRVLRLIEKGAKARGDLGVANDARYELEVLKSRERWLPRRVFDTVVYGGFAGYFVHPLNPFVTLVALLGLFSLASVTTITRRRRKGVGRVAFRARDLPAELVGRVWLLLPSRDEARKEERRGTLAEVIAYRVLVVCALIGLANSNPTLREMFDAIL